jgi:hypothetical protein
VIRVVRGVVDGYWYIDRDGSFTHGPYLSEGEAKRELRLLRKSIEADLRSERTLERLAPWRQNRRVL